MNTHSTLSLLNWQVAPETAPADDRQQMRADGLTIDHLIARCNEFDRWKLDHETKATDFALQSTGGFTIANDATRQHYHLEESALVQMCARYGKPFFGGALPRDYTKALIENHAAEFAPILNSHAANYGKSVFIRTYGDSVRAFMSERFTHIDNADVLGFLRDLLHSPKNGGNYTLVRPYIGRDEINVRVMIKNVLPPGADGPYGVGCVIRTGEIGNVSPAVLPFIQRHSCTNSTVWAEGGLKLKQTAGAPGARRTKLMLLIASMGEAIQASADLINRMVQAQYDQLPALDQIIDDLAEKFEWSKEVTFAVVHGTENQRTRAGLVNGLTYAAHALNLPAQEAIGLEMLGGRALMGEIHQLVAVR